MSPGSRESLLVELVDDAGTTLGESTVDVAHRAPGLLHRAFSVVLIDDSGRVLLQQRAAVKTRFALRWANACCGHPLPGEPVTEAANRRLTEEIGIGPTRLTEVGIYVYRATDPESGRVEHEYDHVLLGHLASDRPVTPDPAEVATLTWVSAEQLASGLAREPGVYAPWPAGVIDAWRSP